MPGFRAVASALIAAACAVALVACGGDDEQGAIPTDQGRVLLDRLGEVEQHVQNGDCEAASEAALAFAQGVSELPPEVEGELRQRLVEASVNLEGLTQDPSECQPATGATSETGVVPTETTSPETTETTPEPTEAPEDADGGDGPGRGNGPPSEPPGQDDGDDGDGGSGGVGSDG